MDLVILFTNRFSMNVDPTIRHTFWNVVVGGGLFWTAVYGINQAQVQRVLSLPSLRKAKLYVIFIDCLLSFL